MKNNWRGWLIVLLAVLMAAAVGLVLLQRVHGGEVLLETETGGVEQHLVQNQDARSLQQLSSGQEGTGPICINTADISTLQRLPNIGPKIAENIVTYRKKIGKFISLEQIMDVPGIGEKTYEQIQKSICLEEKEP